MLKTEDLNDFVIQTKPCDPNVALRQRWSCLIWDLFMYKLIGWLVLLHPLNVGRTSPFDLRSTSHVAFCGHRSLRCTQVGRTGFLGHYLAPWVPLAYQGPTSLGQSLWRRGHKQTTSLIPSNLTV
jgi:hypothetical protein